MSIELKDSNDLHSISKLIEKHGSTKVKISVKDQNSNYIFELSKPRHFDFKLFKKLKNHSNIRKISL